MKAKLEQENNDELESFTEQICGNRKRLQSKPGFYLKH